MNEKQFHKIFRWSLMSLFVVLQTGSLHGKVPDLTKTIDFERTGEFYLGPTGAKGWIYTSGNFMTSDARQILVTDVVPGSAAEGKLEIGDDYVFKAFLRATEAGIQNRIYNDYAIYDPDAPKTLAVLQMVTQLSSMGLIDGVGFQMHLSGLAVVPTVEALTTNFERFAAVGVEVHITEFDVTHCNTELCRTVTAPQIAFNVAQACRVVVACKSFSFWGMRSDLSWLHPSRVAPELAASSSLYPLPFDEEYEPTPVFDAVVQAWSSTAISSLGPVSLAVLSVLMGVGAFSALGQRRRRGPTHVWGAGGDTRPRPLHQGACSKRMRPGRWNTPRQ